MGITAFDEMKRIAREVAIVMSESRIPVNVEEYVGRLKPQLMDTVIAWLEGQSFCTVTEMCDLYVGSIIRVLRRLDDLVRELTTAAKVIGNEDLASKLTDGR